ncbi:lariat debranching enzyme [Lates japonicus]|uniref:Lariat debranching enzyme n=1 Tax=Lates japonicus TaxID=270547 RepID=A0AAD3MMV9_LATJO|nr:lariat debranching enzyme [Lates japonicus]
MKIAVEGCCHGELDKIYETISYLEKRRDTILERRKHQSSPSSLRNHEASKLPAELPYEAGYPTFIIWGDFRASEAAMMQVVEDFSGELAIPDNFSRTVPPFDPNKPHPHAAPSYNTNPQTTELSATLGLTDIYAQAGQGGDELGRVQGSTGGDEDDDEDGNSVGSVDEPSEYPITARPSSSFNPDEITIEDEWEEEEEEEEGKEEEESKAAVTGDKLPVGEILTPSRMVLPEPKSDVSPTHLPHLMNLPPPSHSTPAAAAVRPLSGAEREGLCEGGDEDPTAARILKRISDETGDPSRGTTPQNQT